MSFFRRYRRRSARVLVIDSRERLLLLRFVDPLIGYGWVAPGGGVNRRESLATAAARELGEETGLVVGVADLGTPVAFATGYADVGWAKGVFRDDFFALRVPAHTVDIGGMEELERGLHAGHQWWTLDELATTTETIFPFGLADLIARLLAGSLPPAPIALPWHH